MTPQIPTTELKSEPVRLETNTSQSATTADLGPVRPSERIVEMDFLRGFALLGICVINLPTFFTPGSLESSGAFDLFPSVKDSVARWLVDFFGSGKFNSMFSFLFGVGFAIQMDRATVKNSPFAGMYLRRLLALFAFGMAHYLLLWWGDVLHIYAAIGLPLILARKLRDRWLWLIVALCVIVPIGRFAVGAALGEKPSKTPAQRYERGLEELRIYGQGEFVIPAFVDKKANDQPFRPLEVTVVGNGTYAEVVSDRAHQLIEEYREGGAWFWPIMGNTLVIGYIAGRRRFLQDIPGHLGQIRTLAWWSGIIGFVFAAVFATSSLLAPSGEDSFSTLGLIAGLCYILGRPILCAFYMCVIVLLAQKPFWRTAMAPLASVGRMPLTNYLMQSVVASFLFYGYGMGLYYRIGPAVGVLIAFAIYAVQVVYSAWWMKKFRFGPAEWLWRTLTYGKPPAMTAPASA